MLKNDEKWLKETDILFPMSGLDNVLSRFRDIVIYSCFIGLCIKKMAFRVNNSVSCQIE